jgi:hypothetical protein
MSNVSLDSYEAYILHHTVQAYWALTMLYNADKFTY